MPRPVTGLRIANSFLTPAGVQTLTNLLDFQLGPAMGIEIFQVLGYVNGGFDTNSLSTNEQTFRGLQTLHLETGALETPPAIAGADESDIDTEVFYRQDYSASGMQGSLSEGAMSQFVVPTGPVTFVVPILTARNITHRAETFATVDIKQFGVLIYYRYVEFTDAEMGILLARRS